jgi:hypothetical protein
MIAVYAHHPESGSLMEDNDTGIGLELPGE